MKTFFGTMYEISSYIKTFFGSMHKISSCYDRGFLIDEIMLYLIMYELFHDPYDQLVKSPENGTRHLIDIKLTITGLSNVCVTV